MLIGVYYMHPALCVFWQMLIVTYGVGSALLVSIVMGMREPRDVERAKVVSTSFFVLMILWAVIIDRKPCVE